MLRSTAITVLLATLLALLVETIARGSVVGAVEFLLTPYKPVFTTIILFAALLLVLDALIGRAHIGLMVAGPLLLALAATGWQKSYYLGDPLYPSDFLYGRQIVELLPLLARDRVGTAILIVAIIATLAVLIPLAFLRWRRRSRPLRLRGRVSRLALAAPCLALFVSTLDYSGSSWVRDRLKIAPMMWDQVENYRHNGFAIAFAINAPMARVSAPAGYDQIAIEALTQRSLPAITMPARNPDIIMVMAESFWDPKRLPGMRYDPDPIAAVRALQSGQVFSPEFGGMTANVEFEALTGFSNAFLPYGSIPYQQYVRDKVPTLASFFRGEGYETQAVHQFEGWFWNRTNVYKSFGFADFKDVGTLPAMEKRGKLPSDAALVDYIIDRAENASDPLFLFAVTLQGHGPYQPGRYPDRTIEVSGDVDPRSLASTATFADTMADADRAFARLVEWAQERDRPTVLVFFGDHLPPLGPVYVATGFLPRNVADRTGPAHAMKLARETPLVVWSNRKGLAEDLGTVSPSLLPLHLMRHAGMTHPYYTGVLGEVAERYAVIDRHLLIAADGTSVRDWSRARQTDAVIDHMRLMQYDILFGQRHGEKQLFPQRKRLRPLIATPDARPTLPLMQKPV